MRADRILLVSLDNLGDLVFASALAPPLREHFPDARLTVWCKDYTAEIARLIPGVDEVIASDPFWDRSPGRAKGNTRAFLRTVSRLRARSFDIALLAAAPWRTAAAVAATRIPMRVGLERRKNRLFLTHALPREDFRKPVMQETARILEPFGIARADLRYRLDPGALAAKRQWWLKRFAGPAVALHPFASKSDRCVRLPVWFELADELAARGHQIVWIGGRAELEQLRNHRDERGRWLFLDRHSDGSLSEAAAVLSAAGSFVGHDSGPMHVAGALGVPVIGVFAPGEPLRTFPQGVGPSRMLWRSTPLDITARDLLDELALLPATATGALSSGAG
jgi:ADP-heptose:LPS heptosyltransferase